MSAVTRVPAREKERQKEREREREREKEKEKARAKEKEKAREKEMRVTAAGGEEREFGVEPTTLVAKGWAARPGGEGAATLLSMARNTDTARYCMMRQDVRWVKLNVRMSR